MTCNFSGNLHNTYYTVDELVSILNTYRADDAAQLRHIALEEFAAHNQIEKLLNIYYKHVDTEIESLSEDNQQMLTSFVLSIAETRSYSTHSTLSSLDLKKSFHRFLRKTKAALTNLFHGN